MRYQFVDCRWELGDPARGRKQYLAGHIPGASFLDVDADLSAPPGERGRHPLPATNDFSRAAGRAGIGPGVFVVAYGTMGGAERLWWLLRSLGHDDVAILDGGIDAWRGHLLSGEEEIETVEFEANPRKGLVMDAGELWRRLGEPGLAIVDTRRPERWRGEPNPIDRMPGRIPGARNVPFTQPGSLPEDLLAADEIVAYCGSGVTAAVREQLGLPVERG